MAKGQKENRITEKHENGKIQQKDKGQKILNIFEVLGCILGTCTFLFYIFFKNSIRNGSKFLRLYKSVHKCTSQTPLMCGPFMGTI
jgi:hypothetical protein